MTKRRQRGALLTVGEICIYAMLGALLTAADLVMNVLPNVHLGGMLMVVFTLVYRAKALFPIYVYVFLVGAFEGYGIWWVSYLYIWAILWLMVMLLPRKMPRWLAPMVYALVCAAHGFAFGLFWAPSQMLFFGYTWEQTLIWWQFGFLYADIPHGIANLIGGVVIVPLSTLLRKLDRQTVKAAPLLPQ